MQPFRSARLSIHAPPGTITFVAIDMLDGEGQEMEALSADSLPLVIAWLSERAKQLHLDLPWVTARKEDQP